MFLELLAKNPSLSAILDLLFLCCYRRAETSGTVNPFIHLLSLRRATHVATITESLGTRWRSEPRQARTARSYCGAQVERALTICRSSQSLAERKVEFAARAEFAIHPDASAHFFNQPATNGQTESHSPVYPRRRAIGLRKHVEDR